MSADVLPHLELGSPWSSTTRSSSRLHAVLDLEHADGRRCALRVERCTGGRMEQAYPASIRDVEVQITGLSSPELLTSVLAATVSAVRAADPDCRRIVYGAPRADLGALAAAEQAGFRYVVDVDLPGAELSLLVSEADWVTAQDQAADAVPGT